MPEGSTISADDRFSEKPSAWPKLALFVVIVCFCFSLLNHFYVLDLIAHTATGKHYPIFKQAPVDKDTDKKDADKKDADKKRIESGVGASSPVTNAPPAAPAAP
jgi:hypothetical protein